MERDEFKAIIKGLKAVYSDPTFIPDADAFNVWSAMLGDLPYKALSATSQKYILTNRKPPTVADLREAAVSIQSADSTDWSDGWRELLQAISRYGYYRPEEGIAALSPTTAEVTRRLGWQQLCMSENQVADRANFRQCYETIKKRQREDAILPEGLRATIAQIADSGIKQLTD